MEIDWVSPPLSFVKTLPRKGRNEISVLSENKIYCVGLSDFGTPYVYCFEDIEDNHYSPIEKFTLSKGGAKLYLKELRKALQELVDIEWEIKSKRLSSFDEMLELALNVELPRAELRLRARNLHLSTL